MVGVPFLVKAKSGQKPALFILCYSETALFSAGQLLVVGCSSVFANATLDCCSDDLAALQFAVLFSKQSTENRDGGLDIRS